MYTKKTGKLFEFSFSAPFILAEESPRRIKFSKNYGSLFGIIFQIVDDLLDEINSFEEIGKTPGKDKKQGKRTLLSLIGRSNAIEYCEDMANEFINKNKKEFNNKPILKKLLIYNFQRLK